MAEFLSVNVYIHFFYTEHKAAFWTDSVQVCCIELKAYELKLAACLIYRNTITMDNNFATLSAATKQLFHTFERSEQRLGVKSLPISKVKSTNAFVMNCIAF